MTTEELMRLADAFYYADDESDRLTKRAALQAAIERLSDADPNADWLSEAHMLCTDAGIPLGHITDRIRALRERLSAPAEQQPIAEVLRGGTPQFGYATVLQRWLPGAESLPSGVSLLYAHPTPQPAPKGSIA